MKLYYSKGACSLAVRILINELDIPCEFEAVNLQTKKTETGEDYFAINAKGAVPALRLDNGEVLTESSVIQQYLADKQHAEQLLPPINQMQRYRVLEWLNYVGSELHKNCGPLFSSVISAEMKEEIFKPLLKSKLNYVDKHLETHTYLTGEHFTLPDAYLFTVSRWLPHLKIYRDALPNLSRLYIAVKERKSVQQALEAEGLSA